MMKKTIRRATAGLLMLSMLVATMGTSPVLASDSNLSSSEIIKPVKIIQTTNGAWVENDNARVGTTIVPDVHYSEIYTSDTGKYYQKIDDVNYISVEKVDFELTDYSMYQSLVGMYEMPEEVAKGIASMAAFAEENGCTEAKGVVFVPEDVMAYSSVMADPQVEARGTQNVLPSKRVTWNGMTFYNYEIYFTNMYTDWEVVCEKNSTTYSALSAIKNLTMGVVGTVSSTFSILTTIFTGAKSCLEIWQSVTGTTPIYANTNNKVEAKIGYDIYLRYTYYYEPIRGEKHLGCSTQNVLINQIDTDTTLYSSTGGKRVQDTVYPGVSYKSPNYSSPYSKAFDYYASIWTERAVGKIYNHPIYFSFPSFSWPSGWPEP